MKPRCKCLIRLYKKEILFVLLSNTQQHYQQGSCCQALCDVASLGTTGLRCCLAPWLAPSVVSALADGIPDFALCVLFCYPKVVIYNLHHSGLYFSHMKLYYKCHSITQLPTSLSAYSLQSAQESLFQVFEIVVNSSEDSKMRGFIR